MTAAPSSDSPRPNIPLSRYTQAFAELRNQGSKAFIPFTLLGWPNEQRSFEIIEAMIDGGATIS